LVVLVFFLGLVFVLLALALPVLLLVLPLGLPRLRGEEAVEIFSLSSLEVVFSLVDDDEDEKDDRVFLGEGTMVVGRRVFVEERAKDETKNLGCTAQTPRTGNHNFH